MPTAYILGAKLPAGGANMAYHIGRIAHRHFGYSPVDVQVTREPVPEIFTYDTLMPSMAVRQMEKHITADDLLIANPSFSDFFFGKRLPGRKIMYVQGFNTYNALDCGFDFYAAVSGTVQNYMRTMYGIEANVIPAFIDTSAVAPPPPWDARPKNSVLVYIKQPDLGHQVVYRTLKDALPSFDLSHVLEGRKVSHQEFLQRMSGVRIFVNLSLAEGFGLPALEAMALGTCVTGLDGMGGVDFMRSGENCMVTSVKNLERLSEVVAQTLTDETLAQRCVQGGYKTAANYGYAAFKKAWVGALSAFLKEKDQHAK